MTIPQIIGFFEDELDALAAAQHEFAQGHPETARELGLFDGQSDDPHVNLLNESFAYLTARLRFLLEAEKHNAPLQLLELVAPELARPRPSAAVAEINVDPKGANWAAGATLPRHRIVTAGTEESDRPENERLLRFSTVFDTQLWPIEITSSTLESVESNFELLDHHRINDSVIRSVLCVRLRTTTKTPIQSFENLARLRFWIDGRTAAAYRLFDVLQSGLFGTIVTSETEETSVSRLSREPLDWLGFDTDESIFPDATREHAGTRLMLEYISCPEKFLFFELGIDPVDVGPEFEIRFLLTEAPALQGNLPRDVLATNCVPVVNLYQQSIEPIRLDPHRLSYVVEGRRVHRSTSEVVALTNAHIIDSAGGLETIPAFGKGSSSSGLSYSVRRTPEQQRVIPGTRLELSLVGPDTARFPRSERTLGGRAWCCDRKLPERVDRGFRLDLIGAGPVDGVRLKTRPSRHDLPIALAERAWVLVSHLGSYLGPVASRGDPMRALKTSIRELLQGEDRIVRSQIESIREVNVRHATRRLDRGPVPGFARGIEATLRVAAGQDDRWSAVLLVAVVRHYLATFVGLNSFVAVRLLRERGEQDWMSWPPLFEHIRQSLGTLHATDNFYQVVRGIRDSLGAEAAERLKFVGSRSARFPGAEVSAVRPGDGDRVLLETTNFTLAGILGPLPPPFAEWVDDLAENGLPGLADFLDTYTNATNVLRYEIKAHSHPALDPTNQVLEAATRLLGFRDQAAGNRALDEDFDLLLELLPRLVGGRRTAAAIQFTLAIMCQADVEVHELEGAWVDIPPVDRTTLGQSNHDLGTTAYLGSRFWDLHACIGIKIAGIDYARRDEFRDRETGGEGTELRPPGAMFARIERLLRLLSDAATNARLVVEFDPATVGPSRLDGGRELGVDSWLDARAPQMVVAIDTSVTGAMS